MARKNLRIWIKGFFLLVIIIAIVSISVTINRRLLDNWTPPDSLIGKWTGVSEVFAPFKVGESPSEYPEDWINIEISIDPAGEVTGKVGQAEFVDCTVKQNRNWFEKSIGIKTDYVIRDCYIQNGIVQSDTAKKRDISIPFSVIGSEIKGSIFEMENWKYPDPLFPRMALTQEES
ncbi:MAG: hypothetical protein AB9891_15710 [Anaerolineaceae bacterium]